MNSQPVPPRLQSKAGQTEEGEEMFLSSNRLVAIRTETGRFGSGKREAEEVGDDGYSGNQV